MGGFERRQFRAGQFDSNSSTPFCISFAISNFSLRADFSPLGAFVHFLPKKRRKTSFCGPERATAVQQ
jgi:hypothetical protein